jgi:Spy/CpxP family protein refolding chaperone
MNRFRCLALGILLTLSMLASSQQTAAGPDKGHGEVGPATDLDQHMQMLTERLNLTADQQTEIKPILKRFLDDRQKYMQDQSLSKEERDAKISALHAKADKQARTILSDEQKKKLDELEIQSHGAATGKEPGRN